MMRAFTIVILCFVFSLVFYSCEKKKGFPSIIEEQIFDKKDYYKYEFPYYTREYHQGKVLDSFKPIIYTNVAPMKREDSVVLPIRIFDWFQPSRSKERAYFYEKLDQKSIVYLEKDKEINYRIYYQEFSGKDYHKKNVNKPRNFQDLEDFFKSKNIKYDYLGSFNYLKSKLLTQKEKELDKLSPMTAKTYDFMINKNFYRITVDSTFIKSQLFKNPKDTLEDLRTTALQLFR